MSNVIAFKPSPLQPLLGEWFLDPMSVSRNKSAKAKLGAEGVKTLWACGSIEELRQVALQDPILWRNYQSVCKGHTDDRVQIAAHGIVRISSNLNLMPPSVLVYPVMQIASEGQSVVVHSMDPRPGARGRRAGYRLRMRKGWLYMSEVYYGREIDLFPRSPIFRYYPASSRLSEATQH
jgi:hypothetical protein